MFFLREFSGYFLVESSPLRRHQNHAGSWCLQGYYHIENWLWTQHYSLAASVGDVVAFPVASESRKAEVVDGQIQTATFLGSSHNALPKRDSADLGEESDDIDFQFFREYV